MAALTFNHFDALNFVEKSKALGVDEKVATFQARQLEMLNETIQGQSIKINQLELKEPATKKDFEVVKLELQKEIEGLKLELQKEISRVRVEIKSLEIKLMTIYGSGFLIIIGILAKGFHWI